MKTLIKSKLAGFNDAWVSKLSTLITWEFKLPLTSGKANIWLIDRFCSAQEGARSMNGVG